MSLGTDIQMSLCQGFGEIHMETTSLIWFSFSVLLSSIPLSLYFHRTEGVIYDTYDIINWVNCNSGT